MVALTRPLKTCVTF